MIQTSSFTSAARDLSITPTPVSPLLAFCPRFASSKLRRPSGWAYPRQGHEDRLARRRGGTDSWNCRTSFFAKQLSRSFQCFWRLKLRDCICFSNVAPSKPKRTQWWEQYEAVEIKSVWMKFISLCVCVCAGDMQCGCVLEASSKFKFEACACQVPISVSLHIPSIMFFRHFWYRLWFSTVRLLYLMLACIMFCWLYYISSFAGHRKTSD